MKNFYNSRNVYQKVKDGTWTLQRFLEWVEWIEENNETENEIRIINKEFQEGLHIWEVKVTQQLFNNEWHDVGIVGEFGLEELPNNLKDTK
jgi:hypothetical protein